ncbi:ATP-grasp domain-containing protein [Paenibacillus kobensis]|uniref:ATP-grasp domain-containing protein n=1 Tax=Paenibacillus kobensis TaxID=59841 RepID=UPI000FDB00AC|nr:hypothetical protein [Paenibacillus kobensis]
MSGKQTILVLEQLPYEKGNLHQYYNPEQYRFVFMLDERYYAKFPKSYLKLFDRIVVVKSYTYEEADRLVREELSLAKSPKNLRLVCIDESNLLMVAALREKYAIEGPVPDQIRPFRDKLIMKERLARSNVRLPKFIPWDSSEPADVTVKRVKDILGFPIIVKPTDGMGSKNTYELPSEQSLIEFIRSNTDESHYEFEERITGTLYHCDSVIVDGEIKFAEVSRYTAPCLGFVNGQALGSILLEEEDHLRNEILYVNAEVLRTLTTMDCVTHLEVFVDESGGVVFIEVAARPPGGKIPVALKQGLGVDLNEIAYRIELGLPLTVSIQRRHGAAWIYFPKTKEGIIRERMEPDLKSQYLLEWKVQVGEQVSKSVTSFDSAAEIVLTHEDCAVVRDDLRYLESFRPIVIS